MFAQFMDALQGPAVGAAERDDRDTADDKPMAEGEPARKPEDGNASARGADPSSSTMNLWGMASALAESVKKTTADLSASVVETDWRAEIEAFGKGVAQDAGEVQRHAHAAAREGAARLETLPQQAAKARFPPVDPQAVRSHLDQAGSMLGALGTRVLSSSKDVFDQVAEAVQSELDGLEGHIGRPRKSGTSRSAKPSQQEAPKYSRLEAEISAMQRNSSTYCDQPEDADEFAKWLEAFDLGSKQAEIEAIKKENAFMAELQSRIVPLIVEHETFWTRYFYQLDKLKQKHEQRLSMAQVAQLGAQSAREEERWDDEEAAEGEAAAPVAAQPESPAAAQDGTETTPAASPKVERARADDEPETSTASDDSSNAPWTVVTSPSHKRKGSDDSVTRLAPAAEEPQPARAASPEPEKASPDEARASDEDDSTIDISDAEGAGPGDGESEVEEDWGLWD